MAAKKMLIIAVVCVTTMGIIGFADELRQPASTRTEKDVVRTDVQMQAQPGGDEATPTQLEPGLAKIEADYGREMTALVNQISAAASDEEREALQRRAAELKMQWTLAISNRQLEIARQNKDTAAESEILGAIRALENRPVMQPRQVERDPKAGIRVEGGAK